MNSYSKAAADLPTVNSGSLRADVLQPPPIMRWRSLIVIFILAGFALFLGGCMSSHKGVYPDDSAIVAGAFLEPEAGSSCGLDIDWNCKVLVEDSSPRYLRNYRVESEFGTFSAEGRPMLDYRLEELQAIAALDNYSTLKILFGVVKDSALAPVRKMGDLVTQPVTTLKQLPGGYVRSYQNQMFEFVDDAKDVHKKYNKVAKASNKVSTKVSERFAKNKNENKEDSAIDSQSKLSDVELLSGAKSAPIKSGDKDSESRTLYTKAQDRAVEETLDYLDLTQREKRWFNKVGVDRDSRNPVLLSEIRRVAWTERLAVYGTGFITLPVLPGAAFSADLTRTMNTEANFDAVALFKQQFAQPVSEQIKSKSRPLNAKQLRRVKKNPSFPANVRKRLVKALHNLGNVAGRDEVLSAAATMRSEGEARFMTASVELAAWHQGKSGRVIDIYPVGPTVMARFDDFRCVILIPGGTADWTPMFASKVWQSSSQRPELWFRDDLEPATEEMFAQQGWYVYENSHPIIQVSEQQIYASDELRYPELASNVR